jgi:class 3 adenylate cyclase
MIVVGENTFEAAKDLFECRSLGKATLKGKEREVAVYEVLAARDAGVRAADPASREA